MVHGLSLYCMSVWLSVTQTTSDPHSSGSSLLIPSLMRAFEQLLVCDSSIQHKILRLKTQKSYDRPLPKTHCIAPMVSLFKVKACLPSYPKAPTFAPSLYERYSSSPIRSPTSSTASTKLLLALTAVAAAPANTVFANLPATEPTLPLAGAPAAAPAL